jgi:hypothetical protein
MEGTVLERGSWQACAGELSMQATEIGYITATLVSPEHAAGTWPLHEGIQQGQPTAKSQRPSTELPPQL